MTYTATFLAQGYCFTEQTLSIIPRIGENVEINEEIFTITGVLYSWTDTATADPTTPSVFLRMEPAAGTTWA